MKLLEALPGIIEASVRPMEKIDGIKILQVNGLQRSPAEGSGVRTGGGNLAEQAVSAALAYRAQQPILDAVLGEIGMKGGDLTGLTETVARQLSPADPSDGGAGSGSGDIRGLSYRAAIKP